MLKLKNYTNLNFGRDTIISYLLNICKLKIGEVNYITLANPLDSLPIRINITDSYTGNPVTDLPPSDVYIIFGGQVWSLVYQTSGPDTGLYSTIIANIPSGVLIAPETHFMTLHIERENYTTTETQIPVSVGMIEVFGFPLFYLIIIISAIVVVVGSLGLYRYMQVRKIPTFVKKNKAMKKSISGKGKISDSLIYPSKEQAMVKLHGDKWEKIGLSLSDILGIQDKKRKGLPDKIDKDVNQGGGEF